MTASSFRLTVPITRFSGQRSSWSGVVILLATTIVALVCFALIGVYSQRGFDTTDEGYYLNLIARPSDYRSSITAGLFQYVWHPIYVLTGGSVSVLRVLNAAVTVALTFALAWTASGKPVAVLLTRQPTDSGRIELSSRFMMSIAAAVASLTIFERWLLTPNYNSLNYQAFVLTLWCALLVMSRSGIRRDVALAGVAVGGWLCFLAKPTSAAILGVIVFAFLLAPSRRSLRTFGIVAVSLVVVAVASLVTMGLTPSTFVDYYRESLTLSQALGGHGLAAMIAPDTLLLGHGVQEYVLLSALLLICVSAVVIHRLPAAWAGTIVVLSAVMAAAVALTLALGTNQFGSLVWVNFDILYWLALPAALLVLVVLGGNRLRRTLSGNGWALLGVFFVVPLGATFGTNNNGWHAVSRAAAFWVIAAIVLAVTADSGRRRATLPFFAVAMAFSVLTLALSVVNPYRQESLLRAHTEAPIGPKGVSLNVVESSAQRFADLRALIGPSPGGLQRGVVDLTGESPGLIYASDARALGQPWIPGAYSGSFEVAKIALKDTRCSDLQHAAILVAPDGRRKINRGVLATVGLKLDRDFTLAGTVSTGPGSVQVFLPKPTIRGAIHCQP